MAVEFCFIKYKENILLKNLNSLGTEKLSLKYIFSWVLKLIFALLLISSINNGLIFISVNNLVPLSPKFIFFLVIIKFKSEFDFCSISFINS